MSSVMKATKSTLFDNFMLTGSKFKDCLETLESFHVLRLYFIFRIIPLSPIVELFKKDVFKLYNGYRTKYQNNAYFHELRTHKAGISVGFS